MKSQGQGCQAANAGFTLIELVVVITILGILAAIALPKFVALQTDARIAKLNAARGAIAAGAAVVHSAYLTRAGVEDLAPCPADGAAKATNLVGGTVCTEGGLVRLANGYPASSVLGVAGIISAAGLSSAAFAPSLAQLNLEGLGASVAGTDTTISVIGGPGTAAGLNATCSFTYSEPTAAGAAPVLAPLTTSGC